MFKKYLKEKLKEIFSFKIWNEESFEDAFQRKIELKLLGKLKECEGCGCLLTPNKAYRIDETYDCSELESERVINIEKRFYCKRCIPLDNEENHDSYEEPSNLERHG